MTTPKESYPDWRYLAGLWDGEGCVSAMVQRRKRKDGTTYDYHQMRLIITNTSLKMILSLRDEFGGSVYNNPKTYGEGKKAMHQWIVFNSSECLRILKSILPYLRYKDEEALIGIEFFESVKFRSIGQPLPAGEIKKRYQLVQKIRNVAGRRSSARNAMEDFKPARKGYIGPKTINGVSVESQKRNTKFSMYRDVLPARV